MTLLDFARGPALYGSILIMVAGLAWRLTTVLLLPAHVNLSAPAVGRLGVWRGAVATMFTRMVPRRAFRSRTLGGLSLSYGFHIGLLIILLGGAPHILLVREAFGIGWPGLPQSIITLVSGVTLALLIIVLVRRLSHPVLRLLSGFDDYLSLLLTLAVVLTGLLLAGEGPGDYEHLLALHLLSVEALMIWLPFGKLAHVVLVFTGRAAQGARFARKGAAT